MDRAFFAFMPIRRMPPAKSHEYFALCLALGLIFGIVFDQLAIGLCFGVAIGLALDNRKKK